MAFNLNEGEEIFSLKVDDIAKSHLIETMRWTKFLGIFCSIFLVLICLIFAFVFLVYMPGMQTPTPYGGAAVIIMSLLMIGVNFYPIFALLKFSSLMKTAIGSSNQQIFNTALRYLKNAFKYVGILSIIVVGFYALFFIMAALGR